MRRLFWIPRHLCNALFNGNPRLLLGTPYMDAWLQPGRVVKRPRFNENQPRVSFAVPGNWRPTARAEPPVEGLPARATAILVGGKTPSGEGHGVRGHSQIERKGRAGVSLAGGAVADCHHYRFGVRFIANATAEAATLDF